MDSPIWLPPQEARRQQEVSAQYESRLQAMVAAQAHMRQWNEELKSIDPYLELVRVQANSTMPGLKPGYWYVMRHNPGGAPHMLVHEGENGEYREPDAGLFDMLRSFDGWNDRVQSDREARQRRIDRANDRRKAREREERLDEALILYKALESPSIRFGGSWTAKASAKGKGKS